MAVAVAVAELAAKPRPQFLLTTAADSAATAQHPRSVERRLPTQVAAAVALTVAKAHKAHQAEPVVADTAEQTHHHSPLNQAQRTSEAAAAAWAMPLRLAARAAQAS